MLALVVKSSVVDIGLDLIWGLLGFCVYFQLRLEVKLCLIGLCSEESLQGPLFFPRWAAGSKDTDVVRHILGIANLFRRDRC